MERIRDLKRIKTDKECTAKEKMLEQDVKEYVDLKKERNPLEQIKKQSEVAMQELKSGISKEREKELLSTLHHLKIMQDGIKNGTYLTDLKRNITANLILTEQFKASKEKYKPWQVIKGILSHDPKIISYLERKYMVSLSNRYGAVPSAVNLQLEKPRDIMKYIADNYHLVGIKIDKEVLALVPAIEVPNGQKIKERAEEWTQDFIQERAKEEENTKNTAPVAGNKNYSIEISKKKEKSVRQTKEIE